MDSSKGRIINSGREGILLVNKPGGITSHDAVDFVRKRFNTKKVGHAGTLDPLAQGLLIILVGKYTKLFPKFAGCDKEYLGVLKFGEATIRQLGAGGSGGLDIDLPGGWGVHSAFDVIRVWEGSPPIMTQLGGTVITVGGGLHYAISIPSFGAL